MTSGTGKVELTASDRIKQLNDIDKVFFSVATTNSYAITLTTCEGRYQIT